MTVPRHAHDARSPLHDWRVAVDPRAAVGGSVRLRETPFVGREDLLQRLRQIVSQARERDRLVVTLTGEAGIGKTRLLREMARRGVLLGLDVLWADDLPIRATAAEGRLRLVMLDASDPIERLPEVAAPVSTGAAGAPVVTLLTLLPVAGAAGLPARSLLASLARQRMLVELPVPPFTEAELFELTGHLLGGPPSARLHETISSLSEGNPFLAEEMIADLVQLGLVAGEHGAWYLVGGVPPGYVPDRVATALNFELDAIAPSVVQTLASAAVLGAGFRFDVLAAALGTSGEQLLLHLEAGLAHGIVREAAAPPDDFQFTHELVRRVLYRRLSGIRRRHLHQAVAEALDRQPARASPADQSATLAYHLTRGTDRQRALSHVLRAQERAEHLQVWDDAIRYCREGLDLARQTDPSDLDLQIDLLERLGALYFGQSQTFATGACWREALHLCEQAGQSVPALRRVALAARLAALGPSWYSIPSAEAALEEELAGAAVLTPDEEAWRFDAFHELGLAHQRAGQLAEAVRYLGLARDTADPVDWPRCALVRMSFGGALITAGRPADAAALLREALDVLEAGSPEQLVRRYQINHLRDPRRIRFRALGELVRSLVSLGQLDEAARLVGPAHDEEVGFGMLGDRALRVVAQVELARQQPGRALQTMQARMRQLASGTLSAVRVADLLLLAQAQLVSGEADLALDTAAEGIRLCERSSAREHLAGLHVVRAGALLAQQAVEQAREAVELAHQTIDRTGAEGYRHDAQLVEAACRAALMPASSDDDDRPTAPGPSRGRRRATAEDAAPAVGRGLTAREREVLALMAEGRTNRQIADALVLSDKTVKRHLSNIFDKLGVNSRAAAVRSGFQVGLL